MFIPCRMNTFFMNRNFALDSAYDGLRLSVFMTSPDRRPDAVLQIAHGMCGCKERYQPFMEYMADHGVACVACDHRGHGGSVKSDEDLGYMYKGGYTALVDDMKLVTDWAAREFPEVPLVLLGHSMGSMAARIYAKKYDYCLSGLLLCGSPGYEPMAKALRLLTGLLCLYDGGRLRPAYLQHIAASRYNKRFVSDGPLGWVCSDSDVRQEMMDNPKTNFVFTANGLHNLLGMMVEAYSDDDWRLANPELPVAFLSGEDDACMKGERGLHYAAALMYALGYHNVTAALFTDMRHEILNEKEKQIVWDDILDFIMEIQPK